MDKQQDQGVAFGPGSQASPEAASASSPSVSIPNAIATLTRLIDACEAADGKVDNFGIDCEIERLIFDRPSGLMRRFSRSLDDALALLPEGADWRRLTHQSISVYAANPYNANAQKRIDGMGATPALAMCAAALRLKLEPLLKAQAIEARRAATAKTGAVEDESGVGNADAPKPEGGGSNG